MSPPIPSALHIQPITRPSLPIYFLNISHTCPFCHHYLNLISRCMSSTQSSSVAPTAYSMSLNLFAEHPKPVTFCPLPLSPASSPIFLGHAWTIQSHLWISQYKPSFMSPCLPTCFFLHQECPSFPCKHLLKLSATPQKLRSVPRLLYKWTTET